MPLEPIASEDQGIPYEQESFLADIKSIGGYSGSPVFWDIHAAPFFHANPRVELANKSGQRVRIYLLGIDWAHIRDWESISGGDGKPLCTGHQVELNTGIAAIVPAWKLQDLLDNHPVLKKERMDAEEAFFKSTPVKTDKRAAPFGVPPD